MSGDVRPEDERQGAYSTRETAFLCLGTPRSWAKPLGRANARPMTGSACALFEMTIWIDGGHGAKSAFAHRFEALFLHQRALAGFERFCGVFPRCRGDQLVVVPRIFRLFRLLHLEQIVRNDPPAVDPQPAHPVQAIVRRD